jgi:hypothetical protein
MTEEKVLFKTEVDLQSRVEESWDRIRVREEASPAAVERVGAVDDLGTEGVESLDQEGVEAVVREY